MDGHKDPQRLEHLSVESCLQKKRELRKSSEGVATTEVEKQLRDDRHMALVIDNCTVGETGTSGPNNSVHLLIAIEN